MKLFTISLLLALLVGCVNKEEKRHRYVCDSLNRLDFPPRLFDTLFFHRYENGGLVDTVYPDGRYEYIENIYNGNYYRLMREKDSPIVNAMEYGKDGRLIYWEQEFLHGETISAYTVEYDKNGQVTRFYNLDAGDEGYIYPAYSIHQLIDKLKKENIDLFHNTSIYYGTGHYYGANHLNTDSIPYKKCGWYVHIKDTVISNDTCNMTIRLYDGQTGELLEVSRGIWDD